MIIPYSIITEYKKWHRNWDDLCDRCGRCCYAHTISSGIVTTDYSDHCEFLDERTQQCQVFDHRFQACKSCGKITLFRALFSPYLPPNCSYVKTFRGLLKE